MLLDNHFIDGDFGKRRITEIYETRVHARKERDENGDWQIVHKELVFKRPVEITSSGLRLIHFILDLYVIPTVLMLIISITALFLHLPISGWSYFFILVSYFVLTEFCFQRTAAKFLTGSIVVNEYGTRPSLGSIILRTLIRFVPFEPFSCMHGNRGWHDRWSKTFVIRKDELEKIRNLMREAAVPQRENVKA